MRQGGCAHRGNSAHHWVLLALGRAVRRSGVGLCCGGAAVTAAGAERGAIQGRGTADVFRLLQLKYGFEYGVKCSAISYQESVTCKSVNSYDLIPDG